MVTNGGLVRIRAEQAGQGSLPATATETLFNRPTARFTERAVWPGIPPARVWTMDMIGSRICVGMEQGVAILDASNPDNPQVEGWIDTGGPVYEIEMVGALAYAVGTTGLHIIDCAAPGKPERVGHLQLGVTIQALAVHGSIAYLGAPYLLVVDVSDPRSPTQISSIENVNEASLIQLHEELLYVIANGRIRRFDVSNPRNPTPVFGGRGPFATSLALEGGLAYVGTQNGIEVHHRTFVNETPLSQLAIGSVKSLAAINGVVIASTAGNAILTADFRNHLQPVRLSSISKATDELRIQEDKLFASTLDGIEVYDLADLSKPRRTQMMEIGQSAAVRDIAVVGDLVYLASSSAGVRIVQISPTNRIVQLANAKVEGIATAIAVSNNIALISQGLDGLSVFDVSVASQPRRLAKVPASSGSVTTSPQIGDSFGYLLNGASFDILNISDPTNPGLVGRLKLAGDNAVISPDSLALDSDGQHAVVALSKGGLAELDLRDPANPVELRGWPEGGPMRAVSLRGSIAMTWSLQKGLRIVSLGEPNSARVVGRYDSVRVASGWTKDDLVYLGDGEGRIHVLDVAAPYEPVLLGQSAPSGSPQAIQVVGKTVFVADSKVGLRILDVEIGLPQSLGLNLPGRAVVGEAPWGLPRSAESGLRIRYTVVNGPALLAENLLRFTGPGTVVLRAEIPGTSPYLSSIEEWTIQSLVLPEIRLIRDGDSLYAEWPSSAAEYTLESSDRLDPTADWRGYQDSLDVHAEFIRALLPIGESARFFRLTRP